MTDLFAPPLTDAQVQQGARSGESWAQARARLEAARADRPSAESLPCLAYSLERALDECYDPETGRRIEFEPSELGFSESP